MSIGFICIVFVFFVHNGNINTDCFGGFYMKKIFLFCFVTLVALSAFGCTSKKDEVLRFHVIANSNTAMDQQIKMQVKDQLYGVIGEKIKNVQSEDQAIAIINENKDHLIAVANKTLVDNGKDYQAKITIGEFDFPTKTYGQEDFPAGRYDAVKVVLGEGVGENWWCVMFPPICFVDAGQNSKDWSLEDVKEVQFKSIFSEILK